MYHRIFLKKMTDVSEVHTASIIRAMGDDDDDDDG
jgi:hypothetical protein